MARGVYALVMLSHFNKHERFQEQVSHTLAN